MKYAKYLASQSIPEWSEHYFKYKKLKKELKLLVRVSETRPSEFAEKQQSYVDLLYEELENVNGFYEEKEKELQDQYLQLKVLLADTSSPPEPKNNFFSFPSLTKRKGKAILQTNLLKSDSSSSITPSLLIEKEKPAPIRSEPTLDTPSSSPSSRRSPLRDSEIPTPFIPRSQENAPYGVLVARKYKFAIKRALEEVHRGLGLLKSFGALNSVGFRKIVKKHDKVPKFPSLVYFLENEVYQSHFHTSTVSTKLTAEVEIAYANLFTQGNVRQAVDKLQVPNTELQHDWVSFRFGLCIGACAILSLYLSSKSPNTTIDSPFSTYVMYAFRFLGIPVLWLWTFATAMLIWGSVRINYVFIFGWDPRNHMTPRFLYEISAIFSLLWLLTFTCYYNSQLGYAPFNHIYGPVYPLALLVLVAIFILSPFNILYRSSRWWMFQTIGRILRTPMLPVKFKDFFYTNQFTSLKYSFSDLGDTLYFYLFSIWHHDTTERESQWAHTALIYRPTLQAYPAVLRFLQCIRRYKDSKDRRHMINAGKYTFSVLTVVTSGLRKAFPTSIPVLCIYVMIASVSTIYSWLWDVMMDWDLGQRKYKFLRGKLMYKRRWVYYLACIVDLILRGVWAVTLGTTTHTAAFSNPMNTIAAVCEVMRRFIWNIFRLENEHLKNCQHSNATAIPALIAAYEQLAANKHNNHNLKSESKNNIPPFNNPHNNTINSLTPTNNINASAAANNVMKDYEREEEDEGGEIQDILGEFELFPPLDGIRQRHGTVGVRE